MQISLKAPQAAAIFSLTAVFLFTSVVPSQASEVQTVAETQAESQLLNQRIDAAVADLHTDDPAVVSAAIVQVVEEQQAEEPQTQRSAQSASADTAADASAGSGAQVLSIGKKHLGVPYVFGGFSPSGLDCSGFVAYVYQQMGISLPHQSQEQATVGKAVSMATVQPGDILSWKPGVGPTGHVAIYIGGGQIIHAVPGQGVIVTSVAWVGSAPDAVRRVL